jgi:hypothetical protein
MAHSPRHPSVAPVAPRVHDCPVADRRQAYARTTAPHRATARRGGPFGHGVSSERDGDEGGGTTSTRPWW